MGYYVSINEADFTIPAENLDEAYKVMCELNKHDGLKTGGCWGGSTSIPEGSKSVSTRPDKWFAWMPWNYDEVCTSAEEILKELGFECELNADGSLSIVYYDSKTGSEEHFLKALAPLVKEGSYIIWNGEEGAMWRHLVKNGELITQEPIITWE